MNDAETIRIAIHVAGSLDLHADLTVDRICFAHPQGRLAHRQATPGSPISGNAAPTGHYKLTPTVDGLASHIADMALWISQHRAGPQPVLSGTSDTPVGQIARSLSISVADNALWIDNVFGVDRNGDPLAPTLFSFSNARGRHHLRPISASIHPTIARLLDVQLFLNGAEVRAEPKINALRDALLAKVHGRCHNRSALQTAAIRLLNGERRTATVVAESVMAACERGDLSRRDFGSCDSLAIAHGMDLAARSYRTLGQYTRALHCDLACAAIFKAFNNSVKQTDHSLSAFIDMRAAAAHPESSAVILRQTIDELDQLLTTTQAPPLAVAQFLNQVATVLPESECENVRILLKESLRLYDLCLRIHGSYIPDLVSKRLMVMRRLAELDGLANIDAALARLDDIVHTLDDAGVHRKIANVHFSRMMIYLRHGRFNNVLDHFETHRSLLIEGQRWNQAASLCLGSYANHRLGRSRSALELASLAHNRFLERGFRAPAKASVTDKFLFRPDLIMGEYGAKPSQQRVADSQTVTLPRTRIVSFLSMAARILS